MLHNAKYFEDAIASAEEALAEFKYPVTTIEENDDTIVHDFKEKGFLDNIEVLQFVMSSIKNDIDVLAREKVPPTLSSELDRLEHLLQNVNDLLNEKERVDFLNKIDFLERLASLLSLQKEAKEFREKAEKEKENAKEEARAIAEEEARARADELNAGTDPEAAKRKAAREVAASGRSAAQALAAEFFADARRMQERSAKNVVIETTPISSSHPSEAIASSPTPAAPLSKIPSVTGGVTLGGIATGVCLLLLATTPPGWIILAVAGAAAFIGAAFTYGVQKAMQWANSNPIPRVASAKIAPRPVAPETPLQNEDQKRSTSPSTSTSTNLLRTFVLDSSQAATLAETKTAAPTLDEKTAEQIYKLISDCIVPVKNNDTANEKIKELWSKETDTTIRPTLEIQIAELDADQTITANDKLKKLKATFEFLTSPSPLHDMPRGDSAKIISESKTDNLTNLIAAIEAPTAPNTVEKLKKVKAEIHNVGNLNEAAPDVELKSHGYSGRSS